MSSIVRDVQQSPFESIGWFLGGAGLAGVGIWIYNKYFRGRERLDKWESDTQKDLGIDRLNINKALFFGLQSRRCPVHDEGQLLCKDLDCRFGPLGHMIDVLNMAQKSVDVAIFSCSSVMIGDAILEAQTRGAQVRVVTDAESAYDSTSSIVTFRKSGIPVRQRISPYHMHHKFILIDDEILINGSMNFSSTGCLGNWENIVVSSDPGLVVPFVREFSTLWEDFEQGKELTFHKVAHYI